MRYYQISWRHSAVKELKKIKPSIVAKIVKAVEELANNPRPRGSKKLTGTNSVYRIRLGDYRVMYEIKDKELVVEVIKCKHRKDVYK